MKAQSIRHLILALLVCVAATVAHDSTLLAQDTPWQPATVDDMQIFAPYIGTWQTETRKAVNGQDVYFLIDYQWFDRRKQTVSLRIRQVLGGVETPSSEGFYGLHPAEPRIYHFIAGQSGIFGIGGVLSFDRTSNRRTTRATGRGPDGVVVNLRDEVEIIDANHWKASSSMLQDGQWNVVRTDVFTRVAG